MTTAAAHRTRTGRALVEPTVSYRDGSPLIAGDSLIGADGESWDFARVAIDASWRGVSTRYVVRVRNPLTYVWESKAISFFPALVLTEGPVA